MIRYELVDGQYSVRAAELGLGLCTVEEGFMYYSPSVEADLDLFIGRTLKLKFGSSIIVMPNVYGLWCDGIVALFCDRALVRFVDKKAKKSRPKIKCLELPHYCRSAESIALNNLMESDSLPTLDRNGWYFGSELRTIVEQDSGNVVAFPRRVNPLKMLKVKDMSGSAHV